MNSVKLLSNGCEIGVITAGQCRAEGRLYDNYRYSREAIAAISYFTSGGEDSYQTVSELASSANCTIKIGKFHFEIQVL